MTNKSYQTPKDKPVVVGEPAVAYGTAFSEISSSNNWNPNVPFHGTQKEWKKRDFANRMEDLIRMFHSIDYDSEYNYKELRRRK